MSPTLALNAVLLAGGLLLGANSAFADEVSLSRYIVEVGPAQVGVVQPLDHAVVQSFCRDKDGCEVILEVFDDSPAGQPSGVQSRTVRLVLSQSSAYWRLSNDTVQVDGSNGFGIFGTGDCLFTDGETYTGVENGFADSGLGFGFLNAADGLWNDLTAQCRLVVID